MASDATMETGTVPTPDRNPAATPADALPLPDRNPSSSVAMTPPAEAPVQTVTPQTDVAAATSVVPLPDRNPKAPALLAPPSMPVAPSSSASPPPQVVTDMPPPDPNPNRTRGAPLRHERHAHAGNRRAASGDGLRRDPEADPLLRSLGTPTRPISGRCCASGASAAARIKDPAARDFALWYKYRNSPATSGNAEAIEQFRLAHPDWPAQDELREKAETVLFLTDASPDEVRAFFKDSAPLTGAGKAALAGVNIKDGDEAGAQGAGGFGLARSSAQCRGREEDPRSLRQHAHRRDIHRARIDRLLYPDDPGATEAALRVSKLLPADEQKKIAARIAVVKRGGNAGKLLDALPASAVEADVGLRFNRIQWLRRTKDKDRRRTSLEDAARCAERAEYPARPQQLVDRAAHQLPRRAE